MSSITSKGMKAINESHVIPSLGQANASSNPESRDINTRYFFFIIAKIT
jgi:hypothetical protein